MVHDPYNLVIHKYIVFHLKTLNQYN